MEKKVVVICIVVAFLGLLAAILGFAAEAKRIKPSDVISSVSKNCVYPRSPALGLGLSAGLALMMAQVIINTAAGCICCKKHPHPSSSNWTIALVCFVVSWVTFIIAFLLLLTGAALNDQRGEESMYFGSYCFVVKPGVFSGGAALSLASISLGIIYYVALSSSKSPPGVWAPSSNAGIAMAQPQCPPGIAVAQPQYPPPESAQPVFVHEDTYNRQRFP